MLHLLLYMCMYIISFSSRKLLRILKIIIPGWVTPEVCYWIYFNNWINCFSLICPGSNKFVHVVWKEKISTLNFNAQPNKHVSWNYEFCVLPADWLLGTCRCISDSKDVLRCLDDTQWDFNWEVSSIKDTLSMLVLGKV